MFAQRLHVWNIHLHLPKWHWCVFCESKLLHFFFLKTNQESSQIKNLWLNPLWIPSRELTYPTLGKGKSSSKVNFWWDMLVPWRVNPAKKNHSAYIQPNEEGRSGDGDVAEKIPHSATVPAPRECPMKSTWVPRNNPRCWPSKLLPHKIYSHSDDDDDDDDDDEDKFIMNSNMQVMLNDDNSLLSKWWCITMDSQKLSNHIGNIHNYIIWLSKTKQTMSVYIQTYTWMALAVFPPKKTVMLHLIAVFLKAFQWTSDHSDNRARLQRPECHPVSPRNKALVKGIIKG